MVFRKDLVVKILGLVNQCTKTPILQVLVAILMSTRQKSQHYMSYNRQRLNVWISSD